jgi:hypothetical protein
MWQADLTVVGGDQKPGCMGMSVELQDGERLLKLKDSSLDGAGGNVDEGMTMVRLWQLISGGQSLRDGTVVERRFL